jgi:HSP20 family molecular chaperone IbpA
MTRVSMLSSPLLLGFEEIERLIDRVGKSGNDGYPPYNIERIGRSAGAPDTAGSGRPELSSNLRPDLRPELLRISLAVAGFTREQLEVTVEDSQLVVRGGQTEDKSRDFLYRGIAARQFQRTFVLADGIEVRGADLANGLLSIDLVRIEPERLVRRIAIGSAVNETAVVPTDRAFPKDGAKKVIGPSTGPVHQAGNSQPGSQEAGRVMTGSVGIAAGAADSIQSRTTKV